MITFPAKKFYVATAIDYTNASPHCGHAYQKVAADVQARFWRLRGLKTFFLTGTDEHGIKVQRAAEAAELTPKAFVDNLATQFKQTWDLLDVKYSRFIRTTDPEHEARVIKFVNKVKKDIYKGVYAGLYCSGCEAFLTFKELVDGKCAIHNKEPEVVREDTYFFRLSKYQKRLLNLYKRSPDFILPRYRRAEVTNRVREGLHDLSITRTAVAWGIPFPLEAGHQIYVWFEALLNYLTALGWPESQDFKTFWPTDCHHLGKDNLWFHAVIFPAMLMSAKLPLPKTIYVNGWFTVEGQKMSKSLGNVLDPRDIIKEFGADPLRYYLMREAPYGEDLNFTRAGFVARHNAELADGLGNLVNRTAVLVEKKLNGVIPAIAKPDADLAPLIKSTPKKVTAALEALQFHTALTEIWKMVAAANKYINDSKPWAERDTAVLAATLYNLLETLRIISVLIYPFIPATAEKIFRQLGLDARAVRWADAGRWGVLKANTIIRKGDILFTKVEAR